MPNKTPLYSLCKDKFNAHFINFCGWDMPVRFSSTLEEHLAVRSNVGIFDVSHMGNFILYGEDAYDAINLLIANDLKKIFPGQAIYTPLLYENGTFVDDIIVYFNNSKYFNIVVNAANIEKDYSWIKDNLQKRGFSAELQDVSSDHCLLAIQGRKSVEIISKLFSDHDQNLPFHFSIVKYGGEEVMVANTGYTGEPGVEVWCKNAIAPELFENAVNLGALPCGLGARDSLRLEKGYSLYGHEITDKTNALEAGLGWAVALSKGDFIGKSALEKIKAEGLKRKLTGLVMVEKVIPRSEYLVYDSDREGKQAIGEVTSGIYSPSLKKSIALAYIPKDYQKGEVFIDIRKELFTAQIHKRTFC